MKADENKSQKYNEKYFHYPLQGPQGHHKYLLHVMLNYISRVLYYIHRTPGTLRIKQLVHTIATIPYGCQRQMRIVSRR